MAGPLIAAAPLMLRGIAMAAGKAAQLSSKKGGPALRKEFSALLNKAQNKGATTADLSSKAKKFLEAEKIPHLAKVAKPRVPKKGTTYTKKPGQGGYGEKGVSKPASPNSPMSSTTKTRKANDFGSGSKTDDVVSKMAKNEKRFNKAQSVSNKKSGGTVGTKKKKVTAKKKPQSGHNRLY
jgi:hypothetical protein